jgi:diaminopimelate decarboxylase
MITCGVRDLAADLAAARGLPAFIYDLGTLRDHAARIKAALTNSGPELYYAAKANPDPPILRALGTIVDGIEVASGGELAHVRDTLPDARIAFGGPGKTDDEVKLALRLAVDRIHVESPYELTRLASIARESGRDVNVLLRANLAGSRRGAALTMSGPFGMDPGAIEACQGILAQAPWLRLAGIHAHLASGLDAPAMLRQSGEVLSWARAWLEKAGCGAPEINLGGGMAVDYADPAHQFDWDYYGREITAAAAPGETLRIEPGRAVAAYCGWYVTDVLDIKNTHGRWYAILRGGTMHLRTPVTRQHDQPFTVIPGHADGPGMGAEAVTLVGQLCTPKDVFARDVPVQHLQVGDIVAFAMAGAYGWNISHHEFLMHQKPTFHYLSA